MKLELRRISHYPRASGETIAFDADLYVDDVKVGTVSNSGRGGGNYPHVKALADLERMAAYCSSLPPYKCRSGDELPMNLDLHIAILISEHVCRKQVQRLMKHRLLLTADGKRLLKTGKLEPHERERALANPAIVCRAGERILTEDEAVKLMAEEH